MTVQMPNNLDAYWMPFTPNRVFKQNPKMITGAEGMYYIKPDGSKIIDGIAGLWAVNTGHRHPKIIEAMKQQMDVLDYATPFNAAHPQSFELASKLADILPGDLNRIFYTNSGSESVETALKIALAYHRARGDGARTRLIGREKGYHGVNFGGISVGGIVNNRKNFGTLLTGVDHMRHTQDLTHQAFSKGCPEWGAHLADDLERICQLHGPETIAACIVEPMSGSAGVILPPQGYLKRLREICDKYGILLIFDEVITAFGRLGRAFAAEKFDVIPDIMTMAKGITSGAVPMGAVGVADKIHDAIMDAPDGMIELFHGYTYSGHPLATAAAMAALDVYREENLFQRAADMAPYLEDALHSLKGLPHVIDIRNCGLVGAIELAPADNMPGKRGADIYNRCWDDNVLVRVTGDIIAMSPPLIIEKSHIDRMIDSLQKALTDSAKVLN